MIMGDFYSEPRTRVWIGEGNKDYGDELVVHLETTEGVIQVPLPEWRKMIAHVNETLSAMKPTLQPQLTDDRDELCDCGGDRVVVA